MSKSPEQIAFLRSEESDRKRKLLRYTFMLSFPLTAAYAIVFYLNNVYLNSYIQAGICLAQIWSIWFLNRGVPTRTMAWVYLALGLPAVYLDIYYTGGMMSVGLSWIVLQPPVALLVGGRAHAFTAAVLNVAYLAALATLHSSGFEFPPAISELTSTTYNVFSSVFGLFALMFLISLVFENGKNHALLRLADKNQIIEEEREKSEALLLNILPAQVARELKSSGTTSAHRFEEATILFCDFTAFSKMAETLPPEQLVVLIDKYFRKFDDIMEKYGIEKIKTVGDAYVAASGIPQERAHSAISVVRAAQEIIRYVQEQAHEPVHFNIRVGINTGTAVAGVVGRAKFVYDIWGDAVNIAARMEQGSEVNSINISESTYNLVKGETPCTYRGAIEAKNKGKLNMYRVDMGEEMDVSDVSVSGTEHEKA